MEYIVSSGLRPTLHVNDGVAWRTTDKRIVGKQRVFSRVEFGGDAALILDAIYNIYSVTRL